jgi:2-iminobutanoate/2-iminopropanoate deaminase
MTAPDSPAYSPARRAGDLLFISGQLAMRNGHLIDGGVGAQTRQVLENLAAVLNTYGARLDQVIKCQVYLASMDDWTEMNAVFHDVFNQPRPARSAFGAALAFGARVEVEATAYVR